MSSFYLLMLLLCLSAALCILANPHVLLYRNSGGNVYFSALKTGTWVFSWQPVWCVLYLELFREELVGSRYVLICLLLQLCAAAGQLGRDTVQQGAAAGCRSPACGLQPAPCSRALLLLKLLLGGGGGGVSGASDATSPPSLPGPRS